MGRRVAEQAQDGELATAWDGRRADQSGSVDVVSRSHRTQPLSDRRYLVADRDRPYHDLPDSRSDCNQAGFRHSADSGRRARDRDDGRQARARWFGRIPHHQQAVAGHVAHHLRRSRPLRAPVLEPDSGRLLHRRRCAQRQGRLFLDHGPRRRCAQRQRTPPQYDGGRERAGRSRCRCRSGSGGTSR